MTGLEALRSLGGVTYVASPYSHPEPKVREARYQAAMSLTAFLLNSGVWAYSPILHCHEMAKVHTLPTDAASWQHYNEAFIRSFSSVCVLHIAGWDRSIGVKMEIEFAELIRKPLFSVDANEQVEFIRIPYLIYLAK